MVLELSTGHPSFDVVHLSLHVSKRIVGQGKWLVDLRPYLANPKLTAPDYDWADMGAGAVKVATQPDGRIDSLPLETDFWLVYYNKQIFKDAGIEFPKTFDEMLATARKLTDKSKGQYGFVGRGLRNANVPVWTSLLLGQDQETDHARWQDAADRHAGGDLGRQDVPGADAGLRAAGLGRLQLERMPDQLHAGQDRHVDGRRGLHPAAGRSQAVEDRRPCGFRPDAGGAQGAFLPGLHRCGRRGREEPQPRCGLSSTASGRRASR